MADPGKLLTLQPGQQLELPGVKGTLPFRVKRIPRNSTGSTLVEYLWLGNQRIAMVQGGSVYFTHTDHLGTPQLLTNSAGTVVWAADYKPFGEATVTTATIENNLRFPGQYFDQETGLHYNYFRDYDSSTGRYVESDPIGQLGGVNTYLYVYNLVLRGYDLKGLRLIGECDAVDAAINQQYNDKRKAIEDRLNSDKSATNVKREKGIEGCIRDNEQCKILKSYQCLPEEDCDTFSFQDCLDNLYEELDKDSNRYLDRYQNALTKLNDNFPHHGPGNTTSCPPIP